MSKLTIVIPEADMATENAWMKASIDPEGGEYTFTNTFETSLPLLDENGDPILDELGGPIYGEAGTANFSIASADFTDDEIILLEAHFAVFYEGEITIDETGSILIGGIEIGNTAFPEPDAYTDHSANPLYVNGNKMYKTLQFPTVGNNMLLLVDSEDGNSLKQISSDSIIR